FKIRLPRIRGTMSTNFLFVLIRVTEFTLVETVALAAAGALVQCLWRPRKRPALIQVLFNISTFITSVVLSFSVAHILEPRNNLPIRLAVAVCMYFVANTSMVSLVLALTESRPFANVWRQCYLSSFPYYVVGAAIAGAIASSSRVFGWKS